MSHSVRRFDLLDQGAIGARAQTQADSNQAGTLSIRRTNDFGRFVAIGPLLRQFSAASLPAPCSIRATSPTTIRRKLALATAIPSNWMASLMTICVPCTSTATRIHSRGRKMRICRSTMSKVDSERHDAERTQCDAKPSISISQHKAQQGPTDYQILCILGFFIAGAILANLTFF